MNELDRQRLLRAGTGLAFALSAGLSQLALDTRAASAFMGAVLGLGLTIGLERLWGDRTQPKNNAAWLLIIALVLALLAVGLFAAGASPFVFRGLPAGILVGLFLAHDLTLAPTMMLTTSVLLAIFQPQLKWPEQGEDAAWWVAFTVLFGLIAATLERERLRARDGPMTPALWTTIRLGFAALFTIFVLAIRESLHVIDLFVAVGADPRGTVGRWFLLALFLAGVVVAAFLFRNRPAKETPVPPGP